MGILDDIGNALGAILFVLTNPFQFILELLPIADSDDDRNSVGEALRNEADEQLGEFYDNAEDDVLDPFDRRGELTPENVEEALTEAEGAALNIALDVTAGTLGVELAGGTQLESHQFIASEVLSVLVLQDILGQRTAVEFSEGIQPALEAEVGKQRRAKFTNLQDAVEYALRNKQGDEGYLTPENAPQDVVDRIGSDEPVNPDNLIEEWGIRDDQLPILEQVALNDMEFEELIETPAELGLVVSDEILQAELDRAGYAEETKEFLQQVNNRIPLSARAYQELIVSEDHISDLDQRVEDGTLTPQEAIDLVPDQVDLDLEAMRQRWRQKDALDPQPPSQSEFIDSLVNGYVSLEETEQRLQQAELDTERYRDVLQVEVRDELDGALQEAVALGQLSEARFSDLAEFAGVDDEVVELLLQGASLSDVVTQRLAQQQGTAERSVRTLVGVGEARGSALAAAGIETVQDMAQADPETVAEAAQVSPETARQFINQAQQRIT